MWGCLWHMGGPFFFYIIITNYLISRYDPGGESGLTSDLCAGGGTRVWLFAWLWGNGVQEVDYANFPYFVVAGQALAVFCCKLYNHIT